MTEMTDEEVQEYVGGVTAALLEMETLVYHHGIHGVAAALLLAAGLQREYPEGVKIANTILALGDLADE